MKKVLMLTLGTGSLYGKKINENMTEKDKEEKLQTMIKDDNFPYIKVDYILGNSNKTQNSEFVAEPLLNLYNPDIVIIIGTVKSSWASMYSKFGDKNYDTLKKLSDIEWNYGKDAQGIELKNIQNEINSIFRGVFGTEKEVHIILTRYGLNQEELLENYKILTEMKEIFNEKEKYEVAFDITHSFRSMPIYNLVIFNYLKYVYQYNITIKHVYYGNVEIRYENNNKAPIVDLHDLVKVMDLTNGVSEFENTGNAITMFSQLAEHNGLKKALYKFDWATQINSYNVIRQSLIDVLKEIEKKQVVQNKYADMGEMIEKVIRKKFFGNQNLTSETIENVTMQEMQVMICKWYYQQNRYGQAIATAMEALRTMLVPMYLELNQKEISEDNINDETNRREAVARLRTLASLKNKPQNEYYDFLLDLEKCRNCASQVRNNFAHNLNNKISFECEECQEEEQELCGRRIIDKFMEKMENLQLILNEHSEEMKKAYFTSVTKKKKEKIKSEKEIRVVITNDNEKDYSFLQRTNKSIYEVYVLPKEICDFLKKNAGSSSNKQAKIILNSLFLSEYIKQYFDENVNVIIDMGMGLRQVLHYSSILKEQAFKSLWVLNGENVQQVPSLAFEIAYEEQEFKENMIDFLDKKPVRLG